MDRPAKPVGASVRMTEDEAWSVIEASHTGILTTLRRDGRPVALPIWFVALDRRVYVSTRGKKVARVRHDDRASFLVEAGERWAELRAAHMDCRARVIEPTSVLSERIRVALDQKYGAFRTAGTAMPSATRDHYRKAQGAVIELVPDGKLLTWDNNRLGIPCDGAPSTLTD